MGWGNLARLLKGIMQQVQTIKGLIDRDQLEVTDIVTEEGNARIIRTEWRHHGEVVKADCHVAILCGQTLGGQQVQM